MITMRSLGGTIAVACILGGCSTTEQVRTYIRDAHVTGPVASPPVHVVTDNSRNAATLTFYAVQQGKEVLSGNIEGAGTNSWLYKPELIQRPDGSTITTRVIPQYNMDWKRPELSGGVHLDLAWNSTRILPFRCSCAEGLRYWETLDLMLPSRLRLLLPWCP